MMKNLKNGYYLQRAHRCISKPQRVEIKITILHLYSKQTRTFLRTIPRTLTARWPRSVCWSNPVCLRWLDGPAAAVLMLGTEAAMAITAWRGAARTGRRWRPKWNQQKRTQWRGCEDGWSASLQTAVSIVRGQDGAAASLCVRENARTPLNTGGFQNKRHYFRVISC